MISGLQQSEYFFQEYVFPALRQELPEVLPLLAAGLVGEGSDCFGYDDAISHDHDSGLRLCVWLEDDAFLRWEEPLKKLLLKCGEVFCGRESAVRTASADEDAECVRKDAAQTVSIEDTAENRQKESRACSKGRQFLLNDLFTPGRSGIFRISSFYKMLTGYEEGPSSIAEWMNTSYQQLACAVNGKVFYDAPGKFSQVRRHLQDYYPEDVRCMKLARAAALAAQTGQYNFPRMSRRNQLAADRMAQENMFCRDSAEGMTTDRMALRDDPVAAQMMKAYFAEYVTQMLFLLNRQYMPFYKWAYRRLQELAPEGMRIYGLLQELLAPQATAESDVKKEALPVASSMKRDVERIEEISAILIRMLRDQGLSAGNSDFLMDHVPEIMLHVKSEVLRRQGISLVL